MLNDEVRMNEKHAQLQDTAILWLYGKNCSVFGKEIPTRNGIADALGIVTSGGKNTVYYIEAKASRSDLICNKQKMVYRVAVGQEQFRCPLHMMKMVKWTEQELLACGNCKQEIDFGVGVDFYYLIVADGVVVEPALYPEFGVINEQGRVIRKAKRIKKSKDYNIIKLLEAIAHVLVYKAYGKLYLNANS